MAYNNGLSYNSAVAVTASDTVPLARRPIGIIIDNGGTDGTIALKFADDTTLTIDATAGTEYRYSPKFVLDTGTTATSIKALY